MSESTIELILDTASRIFSDHCDKSLLDSCERAAPPENLWLLLKKNGFKIALAILDRCHEQLEMPKAGLLQSSVLLIFLLILVLILLLVLMSVWV